MNSCVGLQHIAALRIVRLSVGLITVRGFKVRDFWRVQVGSQFGFWQTNPGFQRVQSSVFPDLAPGLAHFCLNKFEVRAFWTGSELFRRRPIAIDYIDKKLRKDKRQDYLKMDFFLTKKISICSFDQISTSPNMILGGTS